MEVSIIVNPQATSRRREGQNNCNQNAVNGYVHFIRVPAYSRAKWKLQMQVVLWRKPIYGLPYILRCLVLS